MVQSILGDDVTDDLIYPERPDRQFSDTLLAFRDMQTAAYWCARIESDPLGPVNKIVRLMDGRTPVKAALCRVPAGATVSLVRDEGGYTIDELFAMKNRGWGYRMVSDSPYFTAAAPPMPIHRPAGWRIEVDGRTVLSVTDAELREPYVPPPPPPLLRRMRAALREQVRSDVDAIAERLGYHRDDECGGY
jgi:hypothetical protein